MEQIQLQNEEQVFEQVLLLQGDECLHFRIDTERANDLRYIKFKKEGLQNTVMSYINLTNEMANLLNFEKFVDRVAQLSIEENSLTEEIIRVFAGEKVLKYLTSPHTHHIYTIDTQNRVLSIQRQGTCTAQSHMGICTC